MHMTHITTSSFPLNTEKLSCKTISRSLFANWQRKLLADTILNLKRSDMIKTTFTYLQTFLQNTAGQRLSECSRVLQPGSYSNNFLCSRKNCGEVNSGVTVSTLPQSASGEIGNRSNDMSPTKERRWRHLINLNYYSLRLSLPSYPVGLPRGN